MQIDVNHLEKNRRDCCWVLIHLLDREKMQHSREIFSRAPLQQGKTRYIFESAYKSCPVEGIERFLNGHTKTSLSSFVVINELRCFSAPHFTRSQRAKRTVKKFTCVAHAFLARFHYARCLEMLIKICLWFGNGRRIFFEFVNYSNLEIGARKKLAIWKMEQFGNWSNLLRTI